MRRYLYRVIIAFSMLLNVIIGGDLGQTFSARNYAWKKRGKPNLCWLIDFIAYEKDHCLVCWTYWVTRKW